MLRSLILMVVLGCGGKQDAAPQPIANTAPEPAKPPPPPKTREEIAIEKMGEFRDAMCKCGAHDTACARQVADDMTRWAESQPRPPDNEPMKHMPEAEQIGRELGECMQKAMTPPDATP